MTGPANESSVRKRPNRFTAWSAGVLLLAGTATLISWRLGWQQFLPKLPGSAPMSPDTGVAFLFAAVNLILLRRGRARSFCIGSGFVFVTGGIAFCFLDRTHVPRDFNQVVFQHLGIYTHEAYPHMALATATGFILWGVGSICLTRLRERFSASFAFFAAMCGALLLTLGSLCLLSYFIGIPEQEAGTWAHWVFRMATESAASFLLIGVFLCRAAWSQAQMHLGINRPQMSLAVAFLTGAGFFLMLLAVNINLRLALNDSLQLRAEIAQSFGLTKNVNELVAAVRETESGQRGFLLTGNEDYLQSYYAGLGRIRAARVQGKPWPHPALDRLIDAKLSELAKTVRLRQSGYNQEALGIVETGRGFALMTEIERRAARENSAPEYLIARRSASYQSTVEMVRRTVAASYSLALALLLCATYFFRKEIQRRIGIEGQLRAKEAELEMRIEERTTELKASESRYRAMLDQSPFAIHMLDPHGNSVGVNPAFEKFFGVREEDLRGYNIWTDPQPAQQGTVELLRRAFAGEAGSSGPIRHDPVLSAGTALSCSSAEPTWVEVLAYPVKSLEGDVQEVVLLCLNVTAREAALAALRESESNFRQLTNTLPQIVWTATPDGVLDYFNERWYEFTGFSREVEQNWEPLLHPEDLGPCLERWQAALAGKSPHTCEQRLWERSTGRYRWHVARAVPVLTPSGEVQRWVGSTTDIDDKKQAEELLEEKVQARTAELENSYKLLQAKEEDLRHSLAERDTLFREVHHRVKNNLQVICSLLRMHGKSLSNQPTAATALEEARRRVLSMSMIHERLYSNRHMDQINFNEYVETLVRELVYSYSLPGRNIESRIDAERVQLNVEQAIPCGLILNELLTNALKYAFQDHSSGLITVALSEVGEDEVVLSVADNGVGLPEGFNWKKSKSMGLPIVDILARQLEGSVEAVSQKGLKVTVRFPRKTLSKKAA